MVPVMLMNGIGLSNADLDMSMCQNIRVAVATHPC